MDPTERRRGWVLLAVLVLVPGTLAVGSGAYVVVAAERAAAPPAGCASAGNCSVGPAANGRPAYHAGELAIGVGTALLAVGVVAAVVARRSRPSRGLSGPGTDRPDERPARAGDRPSPADTPSAPNAK